jgi:AcrR family transcriptional regulator
LCDRPGGTVAGAFAVDGADDAGVAEAGGVGAAEATAGAGADALAEAGAGDATGAVDSPPQATSAANEQGTRGSGHRVVARVRLAKTNGRTIISSVTKGSSTREAVLGHALALASEVGLQGLTIGTLADRARMSKSGLFAHFESKEALQIAVLDEAAARFVATVVAPALRQKRGEPRVWALLKNWEDWARAEFMPGGCVFIASIADLDDRPGPVRDRLAETQRDWIETLATAIRIAIDEKHFRADLDAKQLAHEIVALVYGSHLLARLLPEARVEERLRASIKKLIAGARRPS